MKILCQLGYGHVYLGETIYLFIYFLYQLNLIFYQKEKEKKRMWARHGGIELFCRGCASLPYATELIMNPP